MENLEQQLGAVLGNPEMMQKIMAFAQNFNQNEAARHKSSQSPSVISLKACGVVAYR